MDMPVTSRRPPSLPIVCMRFPEYASFSVLRETPMPFSCHHFKKLKCYQTLCYVTIGLGKVNGPFQGVPRIGADKIGTPVDDRFMFPYVRSFT
jgi:hypothetical protein